MKIIKHPTIKKVSKEELVRFQLQYTLEQYDIADTELTVLAYIYLYGRDAIQKLLDDTILKSKKSIENIITKYRKEGIIHGLRQDTALHPGIKPFLENIEFSIQLELI